jgi:cytochrome c1
MRPLVWRPHQKSAEGELMKRSLASAARGVRIALGAAVLALLPAVASAAGEGHEVTIDRQPWTFGGFFGHFDRAQLQRGFKVYTEVCATCHSISRIHFRNLSESGGPEFPADRMKSLAAVKYKVTDGPNDQGKMFKRPALMSDAIPGPFANTKEASATLGTVPPDLSLIVKARGVEGNASFWQVPAKMLMDIFGGYQEGGADYIYALLNGYADPPADMRLVQGLHFNRIFPGNQIGMKPPLEKATLVKYTDGTPATVEQQSKDVIAFLAWASDPKLEQRKRMGWLVLAYLLITVVLLGLAKRQLWSRVPH